MMRLLTLGLNHCTAPVALRERVAFTATQIPQALQEITQQLGVYEAAILSTCNRTEIYCLIEYENVSQLIQWLAQYHDLSTHQINEFLYQYYDANTVRHLLRVATGLDSLILGEPQILGQVKDAYQTAHQAQTLGITLERLFQKTFAVAKQIRTDTQIGAHAVSVAYAAIQLTKHVFADLSQTTLVLIGAGDTIELAAKHASTAKLGQLVIANRTLQNAQKLAAQHHCAIASTLEDLPQLLQTADIVISSTASTQPIITEALFKSIHKKRRYRPLLLIDLAVPRDIEPQIGNYNDVFLYTVDDLGNIITEHQNSRQTAAKAAEAMLELHVTHFVQWWQGHHFHDILRNLHQQANHLRDKALTKALHQLQQGKAPENVLQLLAHTLTNKLLHAPSVVLRQAAEQGDLDTLQTCQQLLKIQYVHKD